MNFVLPNKSFHSTLTCIPLVHLFEREMIISTINKSCNKQCVTLYRNRHQKDYVVYLVIFHGNRWALFVLVAPFCVDITHPTHERDAVRYQWPTRFKQVKAIAMSHVVLVVRGVTCHVVPWSVNHMYLMRWFGRFVMQAQGMEIRVNVCVSFPYFLKPSECCGLGFHFVCIGYNLNGHNIIQVFCAIPWTKQCPQHVHCSFLGSIHMGSQIPSLMFQHESTILAFEPQEPIWVWFDLYEIWSSNLEYSMHDKFSDLVLHVGPNFLLGPTLNTSHEPHLQKALPCRHPRRTWGLRNCGTVCMKW